MDTKRLQRTSLQDACYPEGFICELGLKPPEKYILVLREIQRNTYWSSEKYILVLTKYVASLNIWSILVLTKYVAFNNDWLPTGLFRVMKRKPNWKGPSTALWGIPVVHLSFPCPVKIRKMPKILLFLPWWSSRLLFSVGVFLSSLIRHYLEVPTHPQWS